MLAPVLLTTIVVLAAVVFVILARLARFRSWYMAAVAGTGYFGRTAAERSAFAEEARTRGRFAGCVLTRLKPVLPALPGRRRPGDVYAPVQCTDADFRRAMSYRPRRGDVFVVTQMKCGTTWMLQVAYETILRGRGDLGDAGARHIHAVAPWIEASWAVSMDEAPRLGEHGMRIVKSHMPAHLLPIGPDARYIYVTRHPFGCFASCVDFIHMLMGPLAPPLDVLLDWFCSDRMWWGSWPDHVEGWWRASERNANVLFVHFEEMRADLPAVVDRVAAFLGIELSAGERADVVRKSAFDFMKKHEERFTMAPPTAFATEGSFLKSGASARTGDVGPREQQRIAAFCRERLRNAAYPLGRYYPDLL